MTSLSTDNVPDRPVPGRTAGPGSRRDGPRGCSSSTRSTPSVARIATRLPLRSRAMLSPLYRSGLLGSTGRNAPSGTRRRQVYSRAPGDGRIPGRPSRAVAPHPVYAMLVRLPVGHILRSGGFAARCRSGLDLEGHGDRTPAGSSPVSPRGCWPWPSARAQLADRRRRPAALDRL